MTSRYKKLGISLLIGAVIIAGAGYAVMHQHSTKKAVTPAVLVNTTPAKTMLLAHKATATGNLLAVQSTNVTSKVNGYITTINYREGDQVKQGDMLVQLDNRQEKDALASAKATADMNHLQYIRDQKLLKRGLIMHDDFYTAAVNNETAQANLKTAQTNLDNKTIRAPFSGTVGARSISIGDYINAGTTIVSLVDTKHLKAVYTLTSQFKDQLALGQTVYITDNNHPNKKYQGSVSYIAPDIDQNSQTIEVHAKLNNADNALSPGQFVDITELLSKPKHALVVPANAIIAAMNGYSVFVVKNNKAVEIPVKIGNRYNGVTEIKSGISRGQQIISAGLSELRPGSKVRINTPLQTQ